MHAFLAGRWAPAALTAAAFALLALGTGNVDGTIWDEDWYVVEARAYAEGGAPAFLPLHPPLFKVLVGGAIAVLGDGPTAWRVVPALAGAGTIGLLFALARRLGPSAVSALVPAVLLLADGLFQVTSRTALMDGPVAFWLVLLAWLWVASDGAPRAQHDRWLLAAGAVVGLAIATKWSAALPAVILPALWWRGPGRRPAVLLAAIGVAGSVYLAAWTPWLASFEDTAVAAGRCGAPVLVLPDAPTDARPVDCDPGSAASGLVDQHRRMFASLADQPYLHSQASPPWTWPAGWRPLVVLDTTCRRVHPAHCTPADAPQQRAVTLPNPVTWWGFLLGLPVLVAAAVRRDRVAVLAVVGWAVVHLPYVLVDRTTFLTWMTPALPFLALGAWRALDLQGWHRAARALPWAVGAAALGWVLPDRVPWQVSLLTWMGWLVGSLITARTGPPPVPGDGRRPVVAAALAAALFLVAAPLVRATPLPPTDPRLEVVDRLLIGDDPTVDREAAVRQVREGR